ncbi:hypothetical protein UlMin_001212 [Ulmus minor]
MVIWEITLGTAYFLGLKRTYRLALRIQRRLITPKRPKIRQFVQRRTRAVFDVVLKFHHKIQQRDIEAGRNLGNWILRWLDKMKPSAEIRGPSSQKSSISGGSSMNTMRQARNSSHLKTQGNNQTSRNQESDRHLFTSYTNVWTRPFPRVATMMRPPNSSGSMTQYRHLSISGPTLLIPNNTRTRFEGVFREDIMWWMQQN